jgi:hypothetical protein
MLVIELPSRLGHGMMLLPIHASDAVVESGY